MVRLNSSLSLYIKTKAGLSPAFFISVCLTSAPPLRYSDAPYLLSVEEITPFCGIDYGRVFIKLLKLMIYFFGTAYAKL
jgi:hypothetical protein